MPASAGGAPGASKPAFLPLRIPDLEALCRLLGGKVPDWENSGDTYAYVLAEAIKHGKTEAEAEDEALKAEEEEDAEVWTKFKDAVEFVADDLLRKHELALSCEKDGTYEVYPLKSWNTAADLIRVTINGVGYFHFGSLKEFLLSGPYSPREAVKGHLHWVKDWQEVYEGGKAWALVERRMR